MTMRYGKNIIAGMLFFGIVVCLNHSITYATGLETTTATTEITTEYFEETEYSTGAVTEEFTSEEIMEASEGQHSETVLNKCENNTEVQEATYVLGNNENKYVYDGIVYDTVFDFNYYVNRYGDIAKYYGNNPSGALKHFVDCGMKEGRQASEEFNVYYYRNRYLDLKNAFGKNLVLYYKHYIDCGKREGRDAKTPCNVASGITVYNGIDYSTVYDYNYYISHHADVKAAFGDDDEAVLKHFVDCGMKEGRQASEEFNVYYYRNRYLDLKNAFRKNLVLYYKHYIDCGKREGRDAKTPCNVASGMTVYNGIDYSAVYDYNYYILHHADVKAAFGDDDEAVLKHFVDCGMKEGRQANAEFDVNSYRCANADLRKEFRSNLPRYYKHYMDCGKRENRITKGVTTLQNPWHVYNGVDYSYTYNYWEFQNMYPLIAQDFGLDDYGQLEYYVTYINKLTKIMGAPTTNVDQMVRYYNAYASYPSFYAASDAPDIRTFCQIFYDECVAEGVDPAVAFCQSMKETGYLRFGGQVSITQYNFAGLGATDGGAAGARFSSVRQGVRAQVQHLKAYASNDGLVNDCVDPRFSLVTRGTAPYVEWLGINENPYHKGWATANKYGYSIIADYMSKLAKY